MPPEDKPEDWAVIACDPASLHGDYSAVQVYFDAVFRREVLGSIAEFNQEYKNMPPNPNPPGAPKPGEILVRREDGGYEPLRVHNPNLNPPPFALGGGGGGEEMPWSVDSAKVTPYKPLPGKNYSAPKPAYTRPDKIRVGCVWYPQDARPEDVRKHLCPICACKDMWVAEDDPVGAHCAHCQFRVHGEAFRAGPWLTDVFLAAGFEHLMQLHENQAGKTGPFSRMIYTSPDKFYEPAPEPTNCVGVEQFEVRLENGKLIAGTMFTLPAKSPDNPGGAPEEPVF